MVLSKTCNNVLSLYTVCNKLTYGGQVVTLQVAMNSANNALLTLLVSNNFVELKGSIFKRFEAQNLFQVGVTTTTRLSLSVGGHLLHELGL